MKSRKQIKRQPQTGSPRKPKRRSLQAMRAEARSRGQAATTAARRRAVPDPFAVAVVNASREDHHGATHSQPRRRWAHGAIHAALAAGAVLLLLRAGVPTTLDASAVVLEDMDCVVEPSELIDVGSAVAGLIAESDYDVSDTVFQNTIIAQIENEVEEVEYEIASLLADSETSLKLRAVNAAFGDRTVKRNGELLDRSVISAQEMDEVKTERDIAQLYVRQEREARDMANLERLRAKAQLERRNIRSPIDGIITKRYKEEGEFVDSEPVFQVARLHPLTVRVIVPVEYLGKVQRDMTARVQLDVPGHQNSLLDAVVNRVDLVADPASATFEAEIRLDNPNLELPSGVRCVVDVLAKPVS